MEATVQVVLYSRPGCHLCEDMKAEINRSECAGLYTLEEVDIESDAGLLARYQFEIPVLCINGVEAFRHRLRADEFREYVSALVGESRLNF